MWNNYWTFLDYLELRRRIERQLTSGAFLFLHTAGFIGVVFLLLVTRAPQWYYFIEPGAGQIMAIWSAFLGLHGLWGFTNSGAFSGRRERLIEREMRERANNDDSYLNDNPKDLFRLHGMLDRDIDTRSRHVSALSLFTVANAMLWIPWAFFGGAVDSTAWQVTPLVTVLFLLPMLTFSLLRRSKNERELRQQMEMITDEVVQHAVSKQKRYTDEVDVLDARRMRLSDDGELMLIEDEMNLPKAKRRR